MKYESIDFPTLFIKERCKVGFGYCQLIAAMKHWTREQCCEGMLQKYKINNLIFTLPKTLLILMLLLYFSDHFSQSFV